jgi:hypothetical protein
MAKKPLRSPLYIAGGIGLVLILLYSLFQARELIRGPVLRVDAPIHGASVHEGIVPIEGYASNITRITLNDRQIFINEAGRFQEDVLLSEGYNIMSVEVEDRFGRSKEERIELMYLPE